MTWAGDSSFIMQLSNRSSKFMYSVRNSIRAHASAIAIGRPFVCKLCRIASLVHMDHTCAWIFVSTPGTDTRNGTFSNVCDFDLDHLPVEVFSWPSRRRLETSPVLLAAEFGTGVKEQRTSEVPPLLFETLPLFQPLILFLPLVLQHWRRGTPSRLRTVLASTINA